MNPWLAFGLGFLAGIVALATFAIVRWWMGDKP
jgi:hypothetical protein